MAYGIFHIDIEPSKQLKGVPPAVLNQIATSQVAMDSYNELFSQAYNVFVGTENVQCPHDSKPSAAGEFVNAGGRHLASATTLLLEGLPNPKALEDARFAVEIAMKAVLMAKLDKTERAFTKLHTVSYGL